MLRKPPAVRPGDRVHVVAPAGPFDRDRFDAGLAWLRRRYEPVVTEGIFQRRRYHAGDRAHRAAALVAALADADSRVVFCARGGYGSAHLLPSLRLGEARPQLLVGFSDVTALHAAWNAAGIPSVHGPVVTQLGELDAEAEQRLLHLLESPAPAAPLQGTACLVAGTARGRLLGGNLAVLTSLVGTPYAPDLDGAVLLLEDVGERPYRLDRLWTQLAMAGLLDRVAGIVLGSFTRCDEPDGSHTAAEVLAELAERAGRPCAAGFAAGHGRDALPLPLGVEVELDAGAATLRFLDGCVTGGRQIRGGRRRAWEVP